MSGVRGSAGGGYCTLRLTSASAAGRTRERGRAGDAWAMREIMGIVGIVVAIQGMLGVVGRVVGEEPWGVL